MNKEINEKMKRQLELLQEECTRVKRFLNENGLDCTTAPFAIAKRYRDELKTHMVVLRMNIDYSDQNA